MLRILFYFFLITYSYALSAQQIAITFDDAPMPDGQLYTGKERTQLLIGHLKKAKVQAAFFCTTVYLNPQGVERLRQYAAAGHLIANHTHSHQRIQRLKAGGYLEDVRRADSLLRPLLGFTPWFRYPFLDEGKTLGARDSIRLGLQELGYANGYVTIDNYDYYLNHLLRKALEEKREVDYEALRSVYLEHVWNSIVFYEAVSQRALGRSAKHVLLLHENDLAARFLLDLIQLIRSKGWQIISPVEAYQDPIAQQVPDVLFNGQGRVAAIARAQGIPAAELVQESEDEQHLEELVKKQQVFR
jgi:peptidoglycan/xylan/chitin deacetylase (PgdA/CDA1 family)